MKNHQLQVYCKPELLRKKEKLFYKTIKLRERPMNSQIFCKRLDNKTKPYYDVLR